MRVCVCLGRIQWLEGSLVCTEVPEERRPVSIVNRASVFVRSLRPRLLLPVFSFHAAGLLFLNKQATLVFFFGFRKQQYRFCRPS